ncbi:MAG TPA: response regulator [Candidatus Limnocylindria bacterium]|jgi:CheY-like chemotaxis protein
MRVLIVDDNRMNTELFCDVLEDDGHQIAIERDGPSGRDRALAEPFDLILLDIQLPGLEGTEVCRALRGAGVAQPILAITSAAMPDQISAGTAAGFDEYLTKPISPAALRDAVRRHAGGPA